MPFSQSRPPKFIAPQVPILSTEPPGGYGWIHEIKHDGFRTLLRIDRGNVRAFTRGGHDWSDRYGRVIDACGKLNSERVSFMRILASMFALILIATPAASQNASPSHDQAALEFLEIIGMPKVLQQISVAMADNLIRTNPPLALQREVILAWARQYITWEAAAPELILTYKQAFTEPELREIIAFYTTPTGQKLATHLPELMQSAAEVGSRLANAHIADLQKMISPPTTTP